MFDVFVKTIAGAMVLGFIAMIAAAVHVITELFGGVYALLLPLTLIACWFVGHYVSKHWL